MPIVKIILYKKIFGWYLLLERTPFLNRREYRLRIWQPIVRAKQPRKVRKKQGLHEFPNKGQTVEEIAGQQVTEGKE